MKKLSIYISFSLFTVSCLVNASEQEVAPTLSFVKTIPPDVAKHLSGDGYKPFPQRKFISWDEGG